VSKQKLKLEAEDVASEPVKPRHLRLVPKTENLIGPLWLAASARGWEEAAAEGLDLSDQESLRLKKICAERRELLDRQREPY
jgi:hypothetical protein